MAEFGHDSSFSSSEFGVQPNPANDQESEQFKADKERIYS